MASLKPHSRALCEAPRAWIPVSALGGQRAEGTGTETDSGAVERRAETLPAVPVPKA